MTSASEVGSVEKSTLSPPSTPPGYIKYYSRSIMADLSEKSIKEVLMVESGEEDDDDQLAILRPSSFDIQSTFTDGRKFFSITIKRRINRFCGFFLALFSFLFLIGFLVQYEAPPESPNQFQTMSNNHFGRHPLTLFSYVSRAWKTRENSTSPDTNTNKMRRLPQCIIIGARKCGTRALIDMLNLHPQVRIESGIIKWGRESPNFPQSKSIFDEPGISLQLKFNLVSFWHAPIGRKSSTGSTFLRPWWELWSRTRVV